MRCQRCANLWPGWPGIHACKQTERMCCERPWVWCMHAQVMQGFLGQLSPKERTRVEAALGRGAS
jgi:hypothetical protein